MEMDSAWIQGAKNEYDAFIMEDIDTMIDGETLKKDQTRFWHNQLGGATFGRLAIIARILLTLPASEACCERYISVRSSAVGNKQAKMKNQVQEARAILASTKKTIY